MTLCYYCYPPHQYNKDLYAWQPSYMNMDFYTTNWLINHLISLWGGYSSISWSLHLVLFEWHICTPGNIIVGCLRCVKAHICSCKPCIFKINNWLHLVPRGFAPKNGNNIRIWKDQGYIIEVPHTNTLANSPDVQLLGVPLYIYSFTTTK